MPCFCAAVRDFLLQRGRSTFLVTGVLAVMRVFLTVAAMFCLYFADCTQYNEEISRYSNCTLSSQYNLLSLQRCCSLLQRLVFAYFISFAPAAVATTLAAATTTLVVAVGHELSLQNVSNFSNFFSFFFSWWGQPCCSTKILHCSRLLPSCSV